jgi:hypothetical protein
MFSEKARELLMQVADRIERSPESYDQGDWCRDTEHGTIANIAAHICDIAGVHSLTPDSGFRWAENARRALGVADIGPLFRWEFHPTMGMSAYLRLIAREGQFRLLAPEEEPDAETRNVVAHCIPRERIESVPSPTEEPNASVRRKIARRIPEERLNKLLAPAEEPDSEVRWTVANRIPVELLPRLLTPSEEPEAKVRWEIAHRIPAERIAHMPSEDEEPSKNVRWVISQRLGQ